MGTTPIRKPPHLPAHAKRRFAQTLSLAESHPRRRLLLAWYSWWFNCVGREIRWVGKEDESLDLEWNSVTDGRTVRFSETAYHLLRNLSLLFDAWNCRRPAAQPSQIEQEIREFLPVLRRRLTEASRLIKKARAKDISAMIDQTTIIERHLSRSLKNTSRVQHR
jgi:hypothetical protein